MRLRIELDTETAAALIRRAVAEGRSAPLQAEEELRRALLGRCSCACHQQAERPAGAEQRGEGVQR